MKKKINYRAIIFLMLLVYLGYFFFRQYQEMNRISAEINSQKVTLEKLKEENENLKDDVELAKTDKYRELLARQMLNLIKDGETPVINSGKK
jgi:cell division protein FtsB